MSRCKCSSHVIYKKSIQMKSNWSSTKLLHACSYMSDLGKNWAILAPNRTNVIQWSTMYWRLILIVPYLANMTQKRPKSDIPAPFYMFIFVQTVRLASMWTNMVLVQIYCVVCFGSHYLRFIQFCQLEANLAHLTCHFIYFTISFNTF